MDHLGWYVLPLLVCVGLTVDAAPFDDAEKSRVGYRKTWIQPKISCRSLRSITTTEFTVVSAKIVDDVCRVSGVIPREIRFEVNLPAAWNGRMMMTGNGGLAGQPPDGARYTAQRNLILQFGFATAYTDTGHDNRVEPGGSFAYNNLDKLLDFGYRGVHLTAVMAKQLIRKYYNRSENYSYFMGCSNGGRQALMAAQRFPSDFDGILAGAPANDFTGLKFSQAHRMNALADHPLSLSQVASLGAAIYDHCDVIDGVEDGLINDPRACQFEPERDLPTCTSDEKSSVSSCYTREQVQGLEQFYSTVKVAGQAVYPAFPVGSEGSGPTYGGVIAPGWVPWVINPHGRPLLDVLGSEFFRYITYIVDEPDFNWNEFDFKSKPDNLDMASDILDAVDPDLTEFERQGGKLLSYFGWADPDINPLSAIHYFDQVQEVADGEAGNFFRLFLVPGMFHCIGGPGPSDFDAISPLIDWVEKGVAPESIAARHLQDKAVAFERPLCPYPQVITYDGRGDVKEASSFSCQ
jgi:feruloyl esterase|tara:strand:- start:46 stop:1605 length:1560 start_codon:yes stop_codon:yes gene_type:complete